MPFSKQDSATTIQDCSSSPQLQQAEIVRKLTIELGENVMEMWFENGRSVDVQNNTIVIRGSNEFQMNRIKSRFSSVLKKAVVQTCGSDCQLEFSLDESSSAKSNSNELSAQETESGSSIRLSSASDKSGNSNSAGESGERTDSSEQNQKKPVRRKGLNTFWFGDGNRLVEVGVKQVFDNIGQMSPFVVYGPTGCGKTHLLESIVFDAIRKRKLKRCVYLTAEQFTSNFVQALRGTGLPLFRRKYRDLDVLAIDDVQFFAGKNATLAEFQHTVDNLTRNGKQVVLSSDRPPIDLGRLGSEINARMMSGLVCPLQYPDAPGRAKIVREICRTRGFDLPVEVVDLISNNLARDVRRLSGAINRIHALSVAMDGEITIELARQALTDLFSISATVTSISKIEKVVCDFCGVKPADLQSSSRQKKISAARMLAMYLSRQYTPNACSEIGDYFGGRSHSTVIAAQKKVSSWLKTNEAIQLPHANYPAKDAVVRIESSLRIG